MKYLMAPHRIEYTLTGPYSGEFEAFQQCRCDC